MPFRIKSEFLKHPALVTIIGNEAVNLKGQELKKVVPATRKAVEYTQVIRAATQKDLEAAYNAGEPSIEKYAEPAKPVIG